ncbi:hypothetical protein BS78_02G205800 [Paspalum vaginatum]|nr:hypothetical protein BS78_02G205800 [Paspalum vaginatum]
MAAAAATLTAVPRCSKRDAADIAAAGTGMSVPPPCPQATSSSSSKLWGDLLSSAVCRPNKAKRGRSPPEEEVEAFLAAAESGLARRFAAKYNYDVVKDAPMDGPYEWVRMGP